jgi:membrane protease YdiL (CAAX protease family)
MSNAALVYWVVLDLFLAALMLLIAGITIGGYRVDRRQLRRARRTSTRASSALYGIGFELGLALPLAATLAQTFRTLGVLPQHVPAEATRWVLPLLLFALTLVVLSMTLGLVLDWRAGRQAGAGTGN